MIIAIDFDGTIAKEMGDKFPEVGELLSGAQYVISKWHEEGHQIIIWTCRSTPEHKAPMIEALKSFNVPYDKINENVENKHGWDPKPKIYADVYIENRDIKGLENWHKMDGIIIGKTAEMNQAEELIKKVREGRDIETILQEKLGYDAYIKDLGYDAKKFKKLDAFKYGKYKLWYNKSKDAAEFEQNHLDDFEREITKIKL